MKYLFCLTLTLLSLSCISIKTDVKTETTKPSTDYATDKADILAVMRAQEDAWNRHDLEGFMQGYWNNDALKFYGSSGITLGWESTLANYKKGYPTSAESGTLKFEIHDVSAIEVGNYWVMGAYHLKREAGDANGVFMIVFKKINGKWKIVADMSC